MVFGLCKISYRTLNGGLSPQMSGLMYGDRLLAISNRNYDKAARRYVPVAESSNEC